MLICNWLYYTFSVWACTYKVQHAWCQWQQKTLKETLYIIMVWKSRVTFVCSCSCSCLRSYSQCRSCFCSLQVLAFQDIAHSRDSCSLSVWVHAHWLLTFEKSNNAHVGEAVCIYQHAALVLTPAGVPFCVIFKQLLIHSESKRTAATAWSSRYTRITTAYDFHTILGKLTVLYAVYVHCYSTDNLALKLIEYYIHTYNYTYIRTQKFIETQLFASLPARQ